ncbi:MAG: chemotaxis protein CheR [Rhizobiales bacterium]|nr:chemotaxis protein CheR [Hyphomicrobiales bacterium]
MTPNEYDYVRKLLKERSGLVLSADKQYLVKSRLLPLVRKAGVSRLGELVLKLQGPGAESLVADVIDAMTTNETLFFRDKIPFKHFRDTILPALMIARNAQRHIRIWCTACSSGQEPYSLAMTLKEMGAALAGWRFDILATDIARTVIEQAKTGVYSQFEVQRGLPITLLLKYFQQDGDNWQVVPEVRAMVKFRQLNLLRDFSVLGTFDVVFCRNVLIYFGHDTKIDVLHRIGRSMGSNGFLVLGAAETVVGLTDAFKPHADRRGLYLRTVVDPAPRASNVIPLNAMAAASIGR